MKQILSLLLLTLTLLAINEPAHAQLCGPSNPNCIVPTAPFGTNNSQAASTAFVQSAVQAGGISGPGSSTIGYVATWGNALGTLLESTAPLQIFGAATANDVLAGPASGGSGFPTFRPLTLADLPAGIATPGGANTDVQFNSSGSSFGGDSGFTYAGGGKATLAIGTLTSGTNATALSITGTWNNGAVTFPGVLSIAVTNTAAANGSSLFDIKGGATDLFSVSQQSNTAYIGPSVATTNAFFGNSSSGNASTGCTMGGSGGGGQILCQSEGTVYFSLPGNGPGYFINGLGIGGAYGVGPLSTIGSDNGNVIRLGANGSAPNAQTLQANSVTAGTSNTSGVSLTLGGGTSTGSAVGGAIWLSTTPAGSSGTAQNTFKQVFGVDGNTHARIGNTTAPALTSCGTNPLVTGSDLAGSVEMGTGAPTGCTITFNVPYSSAPTCRVTWETNIASMQYARSMTAITLTQTGTSNNIVDYECEAQNGG
jgi:hypothetical protein